MSSPNAPDFSRLSNAEVARLFHETRRLAIEEKYGVPKDQPAKSRAEQSRYHLAPDNSVCDCGNPASHYAEPERVYQHPDGHVARMESGEDIPMTAQDRLNRFYESLPDSKVESMSQPEQRELLEWREARIESLCAEFLQKRPRYYPTDANKLALVDHLSRKYLCAGCADEDDVWPTLSLLLQRGALTTENLIQAFDTLYKAGSLEARPGVAKPLDADSQRRLSALAGSCRTDDDYTRVLQEYLRLSGINLSWREAALDSVYSPILERAISWVWEQARADYSPTSERRAFLKKWLSGRFPTVALLDHAWAACQRAEAKGELQEDQIDPAPRLTEDDRKLAQAQALADAIAQESFRGF